jgi:hypothetical protein
MTITTRRYFRIRSILPRSLSALSYTTPSLEISTWFTSGAVRRGRPIAEFTSRFTVGTQIVRYFSVLSSGIVDAGLDADVIRGGDEPCIFTVSTCGAVAAGETVINARATCRVTAVLVCPGTLTTRTCFYTPRSLLIGIFWYTQNTIFIRSVMTRRARFMTVSTLLTTIIPILSSPVISTGCHTGAISRC